MPTAHKDGTEHVINALVENMLELRARDVSNEKFASVLKDRLLKLEEFVRIDEGVTISEHLRLDEEGSYDPAIDMIMDRLKMKFFLIQPDWTGEDPRND